LIFIQYKFNAALTSWSVGDVSETVNQNMLIYKFNPIVLETRVIIVKFSAVSLVL